MIEVIEKVEFVPKKVFIVPYRNRPQHKFFFSKYMSFILEDKDDYEIFFSHQCDSRTFNRGAAKNIGFLAVKERYPNDYKNITFIFNDVDTIPFSKIFDYDTKEGIVKHYYGYKYALGGIVVMKGSDFEKINGFPNYWGWGMEDNTLQKRCEHFNLFIDRSTFYTIGSPQILQLFDGISRIISKKDPWRMQNDNGGDGLRTITKLSYTIDDKSQNHNDNIFVINNPRILVINISTFLTGVNFENDQYYSYDLREPKRKIIHPDKLRKTKKVVETTDDWSAIPYYPTTKERRENVATQLINQGKQVPIALLKQIAEDKIKEVNNDVFNKNMDAELNTQQLQQIQQLQQQQIQQQQIQQQQLQQARQYQVNVQNDNRQYQQQTQYQQRHYQQNYVPREHIQQQQQQQQQQQNIPPNINKYAAEYARLIGHKPKATASARIGLGGVY